MDINKESIEQMIAQILAEKLGQMGQLTGDSKKQTAGNIIKVKVQDIKVEPSDRLDTGKAADQVYTHDLFTLSESPRLGCGIMEMEKTTFDWTLNYDEIDYVIDGSLTIIANGKSVTAGPGEIILIPKGSKIQFSVLQSARFLYVTYPADWADQG
ncbi:cupin domain-containing protein [uncultured Robinsoniella sp.]|uniref:cupin domain-containing protein n=1 Tax=uncultured Robinsoniella sp. TaxID=904190 RepID=UPI00374F2114